MFIYCGELGWATMKETEISIYTTWTQKINWTYIGLLEEKENSLQLWISNT